MSEQREEIGVRVTVRDVPPRTEVSAAVSAQLLAEYHRDGEPLLVLEDAEVAEARCLDCGWRTASMPAMRAHQARWWKRLKGWALGQLVWFAMGMGFVQGAMLALVVVAQLDGSRRMVAASATLVALAASAAGVALASWPLCRPELDKTRGT